MRPPLVTSAAVGEGRAAVEDERAGGLRRRRCPRSARRRSRSAPGSRARRARRSPPRRRSRARRVPNSVSRRRRGERSPPGRPRGAAASTCVSGSPKRALNSSTRGPSAVSIRPANRQPTNGVPRRASSSSTGWWIRSTSSAGVGEPRHRRVRAHAAGVRALVAVERALEVLRRAERHRALAVAQREERHLRALEQLLDDDRAAERGRRRAARPRPPRRCGRRRRPCPPRARPPSRRTAAARPRSVAAAGTPAASSTSFANAFEPSIRAAAALGPNTGDAGVPQPVGDARDERRLRPDHDQVGARASRARSSSALAVVGAHGMAVAERRDAGIAGRGVQRGERRAAREPPRERVLARARPDQQHPHAASVVPVPAPPAVAAERAE